MKLKNIALPFIAMLGLVTISSCSKNDTSEGKPAPVVDFTFTIPNAQAPSTVTFTNKTTNATTYLWNFNDGNATSSLENPQHTFNAGGSYKVKLTATGDGGTISLEKTVTIAAKPTKVTISKVVVTAMPFKDSTGADWDAADGPDLFFQLLDKSGTLLFESSGTRKTDVTSAMLPLELSFSPAYDFASISDALSVVLWDYDLPADANDKIGTVNFLMSDYSTLGGTMYPSTVTKTQNGITFTLYLTWQ